MPVREDQLKCCAAAAASDRTRSNRLTTLRARLGAAVGETRSQFGVAHDNREVVSAVEARVVDLRRHGCVEADLRADLHHAENNNMVHAIDVVSRKEVAQIKAGRAPKRYITVVMR